MIMMIMQLFNSKKNYVVSCYRFYNSSLYIGCNWNVIWLIILLFNAGFVKVFGFKFKYSMKWLGKLFIVSILIFEITASTAYLIHINIMEFKAYIKLNKLDYIDNCYNISWSVNTLIKPFNFIKNNNSGVIIELKWNFHDMSRNEASQQFHKNSDRIPINKKADNNFFILSSFSLILQLQIFIVQ